MLEIRIPSGAVTDRNVSLQQELIALFARSAAMGMLDGERVTTLDAASIGRLVDELQQRGLLSSAPIDLAPLLRRGPAALDPRAAGRMQAEVARLVDTLGESPSPATEWAAMREVLGDALLAQLSGVAEVSLRRYAAGSRATPQRVAERLHWLAMVVADLAGGYNDFGIRRWFERPRAQLGGKSPRETLGGDWSVDDPKAEKVRALAAALSGAQPLAV